MTFCIGDFWRSLTSVNFKRELRWKKNILTSTNFHPLLIFDKKVTQKGTNERRMSWNKGTLGHKCCICLFVAKKQFGFKLPSLTPPVWLKTKLFRDFFPALFPNMIFGQGGLLKELHILRVGFDLRSSFI